LTKEVDYTNDPVCRICGVLYSKHIKCQCCNIYCGPKHFQEKVYDYCGKRLCELCIKAWIDFEKVIGYKVDWDTFLSRSKYFRVDGQQMRKKAKR